MRLFRSHAARGRNISFENDGLRWGVFVTTLRVDGQCRSRMTAKGSGVTGKLYNLHVKKSHKNEEKSQ